MCPFPCIHACTRTWKNLAESIQAQSYMYIIDICGMNFSALIVSSVGQLGGHVGAWTRPRPRERASARAMPIRHLTPAFKAGLHEDPMDELAAALRSCEACSSIRTCTQASFCAYTRVHTFQIHTHMYTYTLRLHRASEDTTYTSRPAHARKSF